MATDYTIGDTVSFDGTKGMVVSLIREDTEWRPDPDSEEEFDIEVEEGDPVLLVAFEDGTTRPLTQQQVEEADWDEIDGEMPEEEMDKAAKEAELSGVYFESENVADYDEFMGTLAEMEDTSVEELEELASPSVDVPFAEDVGIGFSSDPKGWDRSSYLDAWATFQGQWRVCYARMIRHFGPRMAKRWCSALKDEIYGTTFWRNRGF